MAGMADADYAMFQKGFTLGLLDRTLEKLDVLQDLINQGGVDQSHVRWVADDGVGRTVRNGLNFTDIPDAIQSAISGLVIVLAVLPPAIARLRAAR